MFENSQKAFKNVLNCYFYAISWITKQPSKHTAVGKQSGNSRLPLPEVLERYRLPLLVPYLFWHTARMRPNSWGTQPVQCRQKLCIKHADNLPHDWRLQPNTSIKRKKSFWWRHLLAILERMIKWTYFSDGRVWIRKHGLYYRMLTP